MHPVGQREIQTQKLENAEKLEKRQIQTCAKRCQKPIWLPNARIQSKLGIEEKNDNNHNPNIHKCHVWRMKVRISRANHAIQEERPKS